MRAAVADPVVVERVGERDGLVVVVGRGVRVVVGTVGFGAVAELSDTAAAWLGPTGLGVVERGGPGHGLTCDSSGGRSDVCVGEDEAVTVFTLEPVRTIRPQDQWLCVGQDIVFTWTCPNVRKSVWRVGRPVMVRLRGVCSTSSSNSSARSI